MNPNEKSAHLAALNKQHIMCSKCPLATLGRAQVVFGKGSANAKLMFIGEGPGRDEDLQGIPFVGRSGQLLTKIIEAMGLTRDEVYISNVVKCRPPKNRAPLPGESSTCKTNLLFKELEIIQPQIICTLGATAAKQLLGQDIAISRIRGTFINFNGYTIMPTFHPAYLLRDPRKKREVWEDMKKIMEKLKDNL